MSASKISPLRLLTAPLKLALFDPRVTAPLLIALLYYPEKLYELLPTTLHPLIASPALIKTLEVCLSLGILGGVNKKLSQWTANNWKKDAKFVKDQELVLISGGCSGIGQLMAEDFARRGVKVVVLDLNKPKVALRKFLYLLLFGLSRNRANRSSKRNVLLPMRRNGYQEDCSNRSRDPERARRSDCINQQCWHWHRTRDPG